MRRKQISPKGVHQLLANMSFASASLSIHEKYGGVENFFDGHDSFTIQHEPFFLIHQPPQNRHGAVQ